MRDSPVEIRPASAADRGAVASLAAELAQSFPFSREMFDVSYPALIGDDDGCVLVAISGEQVIGYLLGFSHGTFYANGPVGWVEELFVLSPHRGDGTGRALMSAFERWAAARGCALVALATRRAKPFYLAIGYAESAAYLRKTLGNDPA
jgi:GNAT superfamily N-acetyltransferase